AQLRQRLQQAQTKLDDLAARRCVRVPLDRLREEERRLDDWADRARRALRQRLELARQRLEGLAARLESVSPLNVLSRGYSLTRTEADGAVVRSPSQVQPGDRLVTTVQQGRIVSRVEALPEASGPVASDHGGASPGVEPSAPK